VDPQAADLLGIKTTLREAAWVLFATGAMAGGIATLFAVMVLTWVRNLFRRSA
jgi:hypothetical protein